MTNKIRTIVIDDEVHARNELKHLLSSFPSVEIIGEADSGETGLQKVIQLHPDVVFVDIDMGEISGMEMVEMMESLKDPPHIVFATAYPDYAVKAFRYGAIDYLLKPFSEEDLGETIKRLEKELLDKKPGKSESADSHIGRLVLESHGDFVYVSPEDILYIGTEDRETKIVTVNQTFPSKFTLKELEEKLKGFPFFRTHKSYLVNLSKIKKLIPWFNGAYQIRLEGNNEEIPVSRNYVKALRERLEL